MYAATRSYATSMPAPLHPSGVLSFTEKKYFTVYLVSLQIFCA
jgi:hypothetical protein